MMLCGAFFLDEDHTMGWMEHGVVILLSAYGGWTHLVAWSIRPGHLQCAFDSSVFLAFIYC